MMRSTPPTSPPSVSRTRELGATIVARKVNDLADHNQFPMRLFGNNVDAKRGSWALLKPQPKPQLAAQPAQQGKGKGKR